MNEGNTKRELLKWWHGKIQNETDDYLNKHGFIPDVTPHDYTREAPYNWEGVLFNLKLVNDIISEFQNPPQLSTPNPVPKFIQIKQTKKEENESKFQIRNFVEKMKKEIYERIDSFIQTSCKVINYKLSANTTNFNQLKSFFANNKNQIFIETQKKVKKN